METVMKAISDTGKVKIGGGGGIKLIKPVKKTKSIADTGKVKIGGGAINLIRPTGKDKKK
jgi:hypothetical protein